ncbi:MAG: hypothetical protein WAW42_02570 [Candidatus Competibacteraceae bacterium]|jgi:hypothetical protein
MASFADVLSAFSDATHINAPNLAGGLLVVCVGVGGVLILAWVLQVGHDAARGALYRAPQTLLLVIAAFLVLLLVLGVFYD